MNYDGYGRHSQEYAAVSSHLDIMGSFSWFAKLPLNKETRLTVNNKVGHLITRNP